MPVSVKSLFLICAPLSATIGIETIHPCFVHSPRIRPSVLSRSPHARLYLLCRLHAQIRSIREDREESRPLLAAPSANHLPMPSAHYAGHARFPVSGKDSHRQGFLHLHQALLTAPAGNRYQKSGGFLSMIGNSYHLQAYTCHFSTQEYHNCPNRSVYTGIHSHFFPLWLLPTVPALPFRTLQNLTCVIFSHSFPNGSFVGIHARRKRVMHGLRRHPFSESAVLFFVPF